MEIAPDLVRRLKRLRLGGLLPTLPDRATHARQSKLSPLEFLELVLQDEIDRRESQGLVRRLEVAGFEEIVPYEQLAWDTPVSYDRPRVRALFAMHWLAAKENVIFCGPVGVGKSWFAEALGHSACRAGHHVRYIKVAKLLQLLHASRADNSFERELRSWLAWDLLILDDFGLRKLTAAQSSDLYDVLVCLAPPPSRLEPLRPSACRRRPGSTPFQPSCSGCRDAVDTNHEAPAGGGMFPENRWRNDPEN